MDTGTWTLTTPDGVQHTFGGAAADPRNPIPNSNQSVIIANLPTSTPYRLVNRWHLQKSVDRLGNYVEYHYAAETLNPGANCSSNAAYNDSWYYRAIRPTEIVWGGNEQTGHLPTLRALFEYEDRLDYQIDNWNAACVQTLYQTVRLKRVRMEVRDRDSANLWRPLREYELSYISATGALPHSLLQNIKLYGFSNGVAPRVSTPIETQSFTYQQFAVHSEAYLKTANNGWGGSVTYSYQTPVLQHCDVETNNSVTCQSVTYRRELSATVTADGIGNTVQVSYGYGPAIQRRYRGVVDYLGHAYAWARTYAQNSTTTEIKLVESWFHRDENATIFPYDVALNPDPRLGRADLVMVWRPGTDGCPPNRVNNNHCLMAQTETTWQALSGSGNSWNVITDYLTRPRWVRQEQVTQTNDGVSNQVRFFYEIEQQNNEQFGNITEVEEWVGIQRLRTTMTDYFPNTSLHVVNQPARVRVYNQWEADCYAETRFTYIDFSAIEKNRYGNYQAAPATPLVARQEGARTTCSDAQPSSFGSEAPYYTNDWVQNWTVTWMDYDAYGNQIQLRSAGDTPAVDLKLTTSYDAIYHQFPIAQNYNGDTSYQETIAYYGVNGLPVTDNKAFWGAVQEQCGLNEVCTRQSYDAFGRPVRRWAGVGAGDPWGADSSAQILWSYTPYGNGQTATTITAWRSPFTEGNLMRKLYNGLGQLIQEQKPYQNSNGAATQDILIDYAYDALGRQTVVGVPRMIAKYQSGDILRTPIGSVRTTTAYDLLNRPTLITAPNGEQTVQSYAGRATATVGIGRNGESNKVLKWSESNELGYLAKLHTDSSADIEFIHDVRGNLRQISSSAQTLIDYDLQGHKTSMNDPDLGIWSYAYNRQGQLTRQTDARGWSTCLYYNNVAQLVGKVFQQNNTTCPAAPTYAISYNYGANHGTLVDGVLVRSRGQLTGVSKTDFSQTLLYNDKGLLAEEMMSISGAPAAYTTRYGYDAALRPASITYPDGEVVTTSYNGMGLPNGLTSIVNNVATPLVDSVSYDEAARLTALRLAANGPGGQPLYHSQGYFPWTGSSNNSNGRLEFIKVGTNPISSNDNRLALTYGYDSYGNISKLQEKYNGVATPPFLFCYDQENRLTKGYAAYNESLTLPQNCGSWGSSGRNYWYEGDGSLSTYEDTAMQHVNSFTHATEPAGANNTLDANGNFTSLSGGRTLTWDAENRLNRITFDVNQAESYLYAPDGQRVKKTDNQQNSYIPNGLYEMSIYTTPITATLDVRISHGDDDAQERAAGYMSRASTSLSMVFNENQKIGYRFTNVTILPGTVITNAYIEFKAHSTNSGVDNLLIQGQAADNPPTFSDNDYDISSRPRTVASVPWLPETWTINLYYRTPNLKNVVQEIVNRPGWASGNAMVMLVTSPSPYGNRKAISYNYQQDNAAKLHIEYLLNSVVTKYYYFNGQRIAMRKNGVIYYLHNDHLGGMALATKGDGTVASEQGYWPYGRYRIGGALPTDHKFTGQKPDGSGLYYMNARYYDPELGIFISPDTLVPDPTNVFDYNRYMYARGNPLLYNDPTGHEPHDANNPCSYQVCIKDPNAGGWVEATAWSSEIYQEYYGPNSWLAQEPLTMAETHQVLDAVGFVDPSGVSDGANAVLYALEGDGANVGISVLAILPLGDLAKGSRYVDEVLAAGDEAADSISLFRAVGPDELADIQKTGAFRNPPGIEAKYFSLTEEGARQYGGMAEKSFGDPPYTYIKTSIPRSSIEADMLTTVDRGIPAVVVPTHKLQNLASPVILAK